MRLSLSTLLGILVGLGLTAALLVPRADHETLVAQAVNRLLEPQLDLTTRGLASDGAQARRDEPGERERRTVFAVLARLAGAVPEPSVAVSTRVDGEAAGADAYRRAFGTRLNLFNADREDRGLPPVPLAPAGAAAPLQVELDVHTEGRSVTLAASVSGAGELVAIVPPEGGWRAAPDAEPVPSTVRVPGRTSLLPPLLAIVVALVFRKVLMALFAGILAGAVLMRLQTDASLGLALFGGLGDVFTVYLRSEMVDTFRIEIIGFVVALVAMVGIMSRSGGVHGLIDLLLGFAKTVRSTLFVTWGMGILIFFDDYANCLLVGNTMRPLTDRMRISREKLAYLVDSTAAPVAGVSMLSTWIAFEVSTYSAHLPGAGIAENAYAIFLRTIPYRYYCLFTLLFVFLTILLGRDFGPMLAAERRARSTGEVVRKGGIPLVSDEATRIEPKPGLPCRWTHGGLPILVVLAVTLVWIFLEGDGQRLFTSDQPIRLQDITQVLFDGSGGKPIFVGASLGLLLAAYLAGSNLLRLALAAGTLTGWFGGPVVAGWLRTASDALGGADAGFLAAVADYLGTGLAFAAGALLVAAVVRLTVTRLATTARPHLPFEDIRRAGLSSVKALFFAVLILFEAWMIGHVCADMHTADYLVALLSGQLSAVQLPVVLFTAACLVAFATGSSWSTMSILLPNVVALAASVGEAEGMGALAMVVLCIGAVLEGSIFGDHCSPISDTTVLSSVSSASDHVDHVRTQAPYALTTASLAIVCGYIPTVAFPWWNTGESVLTGGSIMLATLFLFGRRVPDAPLAGTTPAPSVAPPPAGD